MPAGKLHRPSEAPVTTGEEAYQWLRYLCVNSTCRGIGGHELVETPLADIPLAPTPALGAEQVRDALRVRYLHPAYGKQHPTDKAKLHLLGLSIAGHLAPRATRRNYAAEEVNIALDTFRRFDEGLLLRDVAYDLITIFPIP